MSNQCVFMFPGQGSQYVGMRQKLIDHSEKVSSIFERANSVLGTDLCALIDNGPDSELVKTSNTQPALLTMGYAYARAIEQAGLVPEIFMGHSLGEYTALVCAGVMSFEDALVIVRKRGRLMEEAVHSSPGKMAAVIGGDRARIEEVVRECSGMGVLEITNFNSPQQVVLSGEHDPVDRAVDEINSKGIARAMELNVSAPFHSSLMKPAAEKFREFIFTYNFSRPVKLFIDNVTGKAENDPRQIQEKLVLQLYHPVLWEQSVMTAREVGADTFVECGPGNVLAGLVKRIDRSLTIITSEKKIGQ